MRQLGKEVSTTAILVVMALATATQAQSEPAKGSQNPSLYLTPAYLYSGTGKDLAQKYQPELAAMVGRIQHELKSERFEIMDLSHTPLGGVGLWSNPQMPDPEARYLGVVAKINIRLPYFPDTEPGRMTDALDTFGLDLFRIMDQTLEQIPDPSVKGVAVVLVYSKSDLDDPKFYDQAETATVFISRERLREFNTYQMTLQKLFDQSIGYYFSGQEARQIIFNYLLRA